MNKEPKATIVLLDALDQAYDKKAWHGPNLKSVIRRVDPPMAVWRPHPARHNIAEHAVHAAYWKYTVRRRLLDEKRGSFALKGSNWFPVDELDSAEWKRFLKLLDDEHQMLRKAVREFPPGRLDEVPNKSAFPFRSLIIGAACHDLYHTGQIQLLKRLFEQ